MESKALALGVLPIYNGVQSFSFRRFTVRFGLQNQTNPLKLIFNYLILKYISEHFIRIYSVFRLGEIQSNHKGLPLHGSGS
jgi:hypothetical protein